MTTTTTSPAGHGVASAPGTGLYRLKPWFAGRLVPVLDGLDRHRVTPNTVSAAGVLAGAAGGAVLAVAPSGPLTAVAVLVAAVVRLAAANLDGSLARRGHPTRLGSVVNELADRLADLALLTGLAIHLTGPLGGLLLLASCLPSWVSLAGASAGSPRRNGGPMGKTERTFAVVLAAATGWWVPIAAVVAVGSVLTAGLRLRGITTELSARARLSPPIGRAWVARTGPARPAAGR